MNWQNPRGFYKEARMRMRISTKSMRSPGGFEAEKVGLNKLIMKDSLSGEDNDDNEFKRYSPYRLISYPLATFHPRKS
ncbi:hypothetical protein K1719_023467 [Acacia pycnantha]|nr:hypothetical protein K1719_023467 [Acacia pycnantha]